jgi:hypothetical protein
MKESEAPGSYAFLLCMADLTAQVIARNGCLFLVSEMHVASESDPNRSDENMGSSCFSSCESLLMIPLI